MSGEWLAASTDVDDTPQNDIEARPPAGALCWDSRSSRCPPHTLDSTRPGGGGDDNPFKGPGKVDMHRRSPLLLTTHRLQVFSYVLAELSSATTLLPDYTKATLNLSRRLIGAWQAVTAAAVARTRYEHALVWAAHHQRGSTENSPSNVWLAPKKATQGHRASRTPSRRSSRRRLRALKKRSSSVADTTTTAASSLPPSAAGAPFDSQTPSHKRSRLAREEASATGNSNTPVTGQKAEGLQRQLNSTNDVDRRPALPHVAPPTSCSKRLRAGARRALALPSSADVCRRVRHRHAAREPRQQFVQLMLQHLWLEAQEAEDTTGQHVEYLRSLIVNALYQQYLQVTVESSYNDLVLYRWISPSLPGVCRDGTRAQPAWSHHGCRQHHCNPSAYQGSASLRRARQYQAAVHVAADLLRLRCRLRRARIMAGPSASPRRHGHDNGDFGAVVDSPSMRHRCSRNPSVPLSKVVAQGVISAEDRAPHATAEEESSPTRGEGRGRRGGNSGAAPRRAASDDGSQRRSGFSDSDALGGGTLVVSLPLHSFIRACLSFDPTHCAFALMSRCVMLAQNVRSKDEGTTGSQSVAPGENRARGEAHGSLSGDSQGVAVGVEGGDPAAEYCGLFYVVIAPRTVGACACTSLCFGSHKFIFVRCRDTESLLRETMTNRTSYGHGACEGSEASSVATVEEEEEEEEGGEEHDAYVPLSSAEAVTPAFVLKRGDGEVEKSTGPDSRAQSPASSLSVAAMMTSAIKAPPNRLHFDSPLAAKSTCASRVRRISALTARDACRLKRKVGEDSGSRVRGPAGEAGPFHMAPLETAVTHPMPSSNPSTLPPERSVTQQTPSPLERFLSAQIPLTLKVAGSMHRTSATAPGRVSSAAATAPTPLRLARQMVADPRNCATLAPTVSSPLLSAREGSATTCLSHTAPLQRTLLFPPAGGAVPDGEHKDSEGSRATEFPREHTDCSSHVLNSAVATCPTAFPTRFIPQSMGLPRQVSAALVNTTTTTSPSFALAFRDIEGEGGDATALDCARRLGSSYGHPAGYLNWFTDGDDDPQGREGHGGDVAGDVEGLGITTQVYVVMYSGLCSCGVDAIATEAGEAPASATAASTLYTAAATPGFLKHSHLPQEQPDTSRGWPHTPLAEGAQEASRLSSVLCAPHLDLPLSYLEQRVLLPPGGGQERRVAHGLSRSGDPFDDTRTLGLEAGRTCPRSPSPSTRTAKTFDMLHDVCACDPIQRLDATAAGNKVTRIAREADLKPLKKAPRTPPDPESGEPHDLAPKSTGARRKGSSTRHQSPQMCVSTDTSTVEPSEGDMAFAAELYARLRFWSLRGQDRSAYIDPSWTRQSSQRRPEEEKWRATPASHDALANACDLGRRTRADPHRPPASLLGISIEADVPRTMKPEIRRQSPDSGTMNKSTSDTTSPSSLTSFGGLSEATGAVNAVLLPLRLLDCTVGTIELQDEAVLLAQRTNHGMRKRRRAAACAEPRQSKRRSALAEEEEEEEPSARSEDEFDEQSRIFLHLPSSSTVNTRGKELLFEALREATEVVVCGVRESRAHTGYHDLLHQRCPSPPPSTPVSTAPQNRAGELFVENANNRGYSPSTGTATEAAATLTAGTLLKSDWLTAVSPWMAAAAAATQGRSFRVVTGTLSRDERNPFAFDTHRHLGMCGIVRWSQGDLSHEEEARDFAMNDRGAEDMMNVEVSTSGCPSQASRATTGGATPHSDSFHAPQRWMPQLPDNDHKQWRCELLKSEFRLARSRCLDCLLVDHTHGRPIGAITLAPWTSPQTSFDPPSGAAYGDDVIRADKQTFTRRDTERQRANTEVGDVPSPQVVVQRTIYVVVGFTHYIAPLWRHLREEKAVLVDMDRTLIDNVITMRSAAERQRHLRHLHRTVTVAEGLSGPANPCFLWHRQTALSSPTSASRADASFGLGRNDAPRLTEEELVESMAKGVSGGPGDGLPCGSKGSCRRCAYFSQDGYTDIVENDGVLRPTVREGVPHTRGDPWCHTQAAAEVSALSSGGLLHRFMRRTASQRQSLGITHYEECGVVKYTAGSSPAFQSDSVAEPPSKGGRNRCESRNTWATSSEPRADADACKSNSEQSAAAAATVASAPSAPCVSEVVYVRPGVRQFLYRVATQWNIPLVLVTKSTRSRTEAILRQVLDPHGVLFPDTRSNVVTADELLRWFDDEAMCGGDLGGYEGASGGSCLGSGDSNGPGAVLNQTSPASSTLDVDYAGLGLSRAPTSTPVSVANAIMRCRKNALKVVQHALDSDAMMAARRAWRAPMWCDLPNRLPKPRSIAVLDDAPQMWEEADWRCTVNVAPYTHIRVDPQAYFSRRGYVSSLVLSCLYGSKCLVCSEGVLRMPERQGAKTSLVSSSPHTPEAALSIRACSRLEAYRWPHCVCVCPPDHLRDVAGAVEDVPFGYSDASHTTTTAATGMSAGVHAMLKALLWRMSSQVAVGSSAPPLLLQGNDDSVATEVTEQVMAIDGWVGPSLRRRRPRHGGDLDVAIARVRKEGGSSLRATAGIEGRGEAIPPALVTTSAGSSRVGQGMLLRLVDTVGADGTTPTSSPPLPLLAGVEGHTAALASASEQSFSSPVPSLYSVRSPSSSATVSSFSSLQSAWDSAPGNATTDTTADLDSDTPSLMVTEASMPPTPKAFRTRPDASLESVALVGCAEVEDADQHEWRIDAGNSFANAMVGRRDEAAVEGSVVQGLTTATPLQPPPATESLAPGRLAGRM